MIRLSDECDSIVPLLSIEEEPKSSQEFDEMLEWQADDNPSMTDTVSSPVVQSERKWNGRKDKCSFGEVRTVFLFPAL